MLKLVSPVERELKVIGVIARHDMKLLDQFHINTMNLLKEVRTLYNMQVYIGNQIKNAGYLLLFIQVCVISGEKLGNQINLVTED